MADKSKKLKDVRNEVIAKAWKDPTFKKRLLGNPKAVLTECGMTFPENMNVKVIEDTSDTYTFVIPKTPAKMQELEDQVLETIAGGTCTPETTSCFL
jgi:hypothetical protein